LKVSHPPRGRSGFPRAAYAAVGAGRKRKKKRIGLQKYFDLFQKVPAIKPAKKSWARFLKARQEKIELISLGQKRKSFKTSSLKKLAIARNAFLKTGR
jgi:hypothetical protein